MIDPEEFKLIEGYATECNLCHSNTISFVQTPDMWAFSMEYATIEIKYNYPKLCSECAMAIIITLSQRAQIRK